MQNPLQWQSMRIRITLTAVLLGAFALGSCADDEENPASQCIALIATGCDRAMSCLVSLDILTQSQYRASADQCERSATEIIPCEYATAVGDSYAQCLRDILAIPCAFWESSDIESFVLTLPASCTNAIVVE
jgi:hypothetical protein